MKSFTPVNSDSSQLLQDSLTPEDSHVLDILLALSVLDDKDSANPVGTGARRAHGKLRQWRIRQDVA